MARKPTRVTDIGDSISELADLDQIELSLARDIALTVRARRKKEEQDVFRGDLDLLKRRVLLAAGSGFLALLLIAFAVSAIRAVVGADFPALGLVASGGGIVSILAAWIRWG